MKTPATALSIAANARRFARIVLGVLIPTAIVMMALGPRTVKLGLDRAPVLHPHWPRVRLIAEAGPAVQIHLLCVTIALAIGIALLVGVKGSARHRVLGWIWVAAMLTGAVSSFFIRIVNHGSLSFIHLLSGWIVIALPLALIAIRRGKVRAHARMMTGLFTGGLILAGLFAFIPGRLMWDMLFR